MTEIPSKFKLQAMLLKKTEVFFRYDRPVLIIAATWHETSIPYGRMLRDDFTRKYVDNEDAVSDSLHGCDW